MPAAPLVRLLALLPLLATACEKGAGLPATPPLSASLPADGALDVPVTAWFVLDFAGPVAELQGPQFGLFCEGDGERRPVFATAVPGDRLILAPRQLLPFARDCVLSFHTTAGDEAIHVTTAAEGAPFRVLHDRTDPTRIAPYPDDFHLVSDPATRTGQRQAIPVPDFHENHAAVFGALLAEANGLDGFSPLGPMVIEVEAIVAPESLPATPAESLDPASTVVLLDLTPWSAGFGRRVPFQIQARRDRTAFGLRSRTLILFPSIPLEPEGRYGLYVTRRVLASEGRPLAPSAYFAAVLGAPVAGEAAAITRDRETLAEVLEAGRKVLRPSLLPEHLAYAARISVRSTRPIEDDVLAMKAQILAADPPAVQIDEGDPDAIVAMPAANVAALVRGTWDAPDWRSGLSLARDGAGRPILTGSRPACFRLALPEAALAGPVPVVIYQHGNPGESETEVLGNAVRFLAEAGYAVIGFTDILNREVAPPSAAPGPACVAYESPTLSVEARITTQVFGIVLDLLAEGRISDHWSQTLGEQLAFVRAIQGLADLDLLPVGAPDGVPDLDVSKLLYMGISEGGNNGQAFVAYAPEVRAAALMVGGARLMETLLHQQAATFLSQLPLLFPAFTPADIWTAVAIFQSDFDRQDKHNHGRFVYRQPVAIPLACDDVAACLAPGWCDVPGRCTKTKPSVLLVEGLDDSLVPNHATESAAWQLGPIPQLEPVKRAVPFLKTRQEAVAGNIDRSTTAAFYQYVPDGVPGIPITPGCQAPPLSPTSSSEGHFCAQSAVESRAQRLIFFGSAVDPRRSAPLIVDPLPFYPEGTPLFPLPDTSKLP